MAVSVYTLTDKIVGRKERTLGVFITQEEAEENAISISHEYYSEAEGSISDVTFRIYRFTLGRIINSKRRNECLVKELPLNDIITQNLLTQLVFKRLLDAGVKKEMAENLINQPFEHQKCSYLTARERMISLINDKRHDCLTCKELLESIGLEDEVLEHLIYVVKELIDHEGNWGAAESAIHYATNAHLKIEDYEILLLREQARRERK